MRRAAAVLAAALLGAGAVPAAAGAGPAAPSARPGAAAAETPAVAEPTGGVAYEGDDRSRVRLAPPLAAAAEEYANAGYRLRRGAAAGELVVEVSLAPLASRAPFAPPGGARAAGVAAPPARGAAAGRPTAEPAAALGAGDEVARAARAAAADAATVYGAVGAVLGWIVHNVSASEDDLAGGPAAAPGAAPPAGQQARRLEAGVATSRGAGSAAAPSVRRPAEVLAAGAGGAADVAGLAVAMLDALGIEARTVHGRVVGPPRPGAPRGTHTWIEVRYPDRGWAFSDPLHHHHYVPASYVRLAAGAAEGGAAADGAVELVARDDRRRPVDAYPPGGPGVGARRNDDTQVAAALRVVVPGAGEGAAVLTAADGTTQRKALRGGEGVFVGLAGGAYTLEVLVPGRPRLARELELAPRERSAVLFGGDAAAQREPGAEPAPAAVRPDPPGQARRRAPR